MNKIMISLAFAGIIATAGPSSAMTILPESLSTASTQAQQARWHGESGDDWNRHHGREWRRPGWRHDNGLHRGWYKGKHRGWYPHHWY